MFKRAKVVILSTEKVSHIVYNNNARGLFYGGTAILASNRMGNCTNQHLYIFSDEEIKKGDWVYNPIYKTVYQWIENDSIKFDRIDAQKIIATTDKSLIIGVPQFIKEYLPKPSDSFIKKYVQAYNDGNPITEVMVEYENIYKGTEGWVGDDYTGEPVWFEKIISELKVNPKDDTITIRKAKDSWNREEVISILHERMKYTLGKYYDPSSTLDWVKENL